MVVFWQKTFFNPKKIIYEPTALASETQFQNIPSIRFPIANFSSRDVFLASKSENPTRNNKKTQKELYNRLHSGNLYVLGIEKMVVDNMNQHLSCSSIDLLHKNLVSTNKTLLFFFSFNSTPSSTHHPPFLPLLPPLHFRMSRFDFAGSGETFSYVPSP